jgi:hypothetical protein
MQDNTSLPLAFSLEPDWGDVEEREEERESDIYSDGLTLACIRGQSIQHLDALERNRIRRHAKRYTWNEEEQLVFYKTAKHPGVLGSHYRCHVRHWS